MNGYIEDQGNSNCCNIHPTEVVVGICPLCLKERLLILLASSSSSKHAHHYHHHPRRSRSRRSHHIYVFQKVSALGSFLRRSSVASRPQQKLDSTGGNDTTSTSQEDSFISIKFGDDGCASWDKGGRDSKPASLLVDQEAMNLKLPSSNHNLMNKKQLLYSTTTSSTRVKKSTSKSSSSSSSSIVEHNITSTPRGGTLRWQKRVGQVLFQLVRLKKRSTLMDQSSCHVSSSGKVNGSLKTRKGWIKTLTKKRDHAI